MTQTKSRRTGSRAPTPGSVAPEGLAPERAALDDGPAHAHGPDDPHAHAHLPASAGAVLTQDALALAETYCRSRGENLTPIRRKVLELLLASGRATKAYALLDDMRRIHPGSAPPTIYRALDFLLTAGLVHRVESINAFAACHDLTHCQHGILVVCQQCGDVTELHQPALRQSLAAQIDAAGYRLAGAEIELKGICSTCSSPAAAGA